MTNSAQLLEQFALPEEVKARRMWCSYMELGIVYCICQGETEGLKQNAQRWMLAKMLAKILGTEMVCRVGCISAWSHLWKRWDWH